MPDLFAPFSLRGIELRNRIAMSPMCMYSAGTDGRVTDWHTAHYLSRAVGGVAMIVMEATAVEARGRISTGDLGLWDDDQIGPLTNLVRQTHAAGAAIGVQLAHAGRKAWSSSKGVGPLAAVAPSAQAFVAGWQTPRELTTEDVPAVVEAWAAAAARAEAAGCDFVEIHGAHGYLVHEFLSPLSNHRTDDYGGSPSKRLRFLLEVVGAVRGVWPQERPLLVRLSATDWVEGGLTVADTVEIARHLREAGVDLVDCSSGGNTPTPPRPIGPGYQIGFAARVREGAGVPTSAVGLITSAQQADTVIRTGQADMVMLGRELLRHPYWPLDAASRLGADITWPVQYARARR